METIKEITPSLDNWTTLFALAIGHGLFLAVVLLFGKNTSRSKNTFLGLLMIAFSVTLFEYVLHWSNYIYHYPLCLYWYKTIVFIFGPLLYLYLKAIQTPGERSWKDGLHFLPALLFFLNYWPFYTSSIAAKQDLLYHGKAAAEGLVFPFLNLVKWEPFLFVGHLSFYALMIALLMYREKLFKRTSTNTLHLIKVNWFFTLFLLYVGFVLGNLSYYILIQTPFFKIEYDYGISLAMVLFIYTVGYLGYRRPQIFDGSLWQGLFLAPKYQNSSLTMAASQSLRERLLRYFDEQKPYLDNELRLSSVAEKLDTSTHHLSQVINQEIGKSFADFVNTYRIEEAKRLLGDPDNKEFIIQIAYAAGFNNKTTFNKAFKASTGRAPSIYRKEVGYQQKEMS